MKKIRYRLIYNRKKKLNAQGTALLQIEAYLDKKKIYFSSNIYLKPEQWDKKRLLIKKHPNAEALNYMLREFIVNLEEKELSLWKSGYSITLEALKDESKDKAGESFLHFIRHDISASQNKPSTKKNYYCPLNT